MKAETYSALLKDLQKLQKAIVTSQIAVVRGDSAQLATLSRLHGEAEVGGRLDDFVATAARKSTVLLLLRTVFVRVLEDLGILGVKRIRDEWGFAAFREVAPALGIRAYLAFVFRDLAVDFPALFAPGEDELPLPDEDGCRALWNLWHHPNKDGELYVWNGDGFDSRFLGDLYQDLDADIRKRYALLQTPPFVEKYILDHTLTPALAEFDPEALRAKGERFRLLDPTCGSGHFLIGAFHRLADYWRDRHGFSDWAACERALESVWGCDINPHAVDIADFRLLLELVARVGVKDLDRLAELKLNLRAMDSLIPWERAASQGELFPAKDRLDAYATPAQRQENAAFLGRAFHIVVGNPPYITPKEAQKRDDYRVFWPSSAAGKYALSAPFVERMFSLGTGGALVGQITANSFTKRSFGRSLIQKVLPRFDLARVVDTSGAYIPAHGTPTVILIGRARAPTDGPVWTILSKRGEPKRPRHAEHGLVWKAIVAAGAEPDDSSPFVTIAHIARSYFAGHPWSLGGGAARDLLAALDSAKQTTLATLAQDIGPSAFTGQDALFILEADHAKRLGLHPQSQHAMSEGDSIRDFTIATDDRVVIFSYTLGSEGLEECERSDIKRALWPWNQWVLERPMKGFRKIRHEPAFKYRLSFFYPSRATAPRLAFTEVATHNHVVLDTTGVLLKQTAPVIKLSDAASLSDYEGLLGLLNTSVLEFWGKQVFHDKGGGGIGGGLASEEWEHFIQRDSTKMQDAPVTTRDVGARIALVRAMTASARARAACLPAAVLRGLTWSPESIVIELMNARGRYLTETHRMVTLQEELDWLTYRSFDLVGVDRAIAAGSVEPLAPGHRPFEIVFARTDDEADDDEKSVWWFRHGHERVTEIPDMYSAEHRAWLQQRIDLIESDPRIALLETPPFKRRWQLPDWESETKKAAESWLLSGLEDLFAAATDTASRGPLAEPKPYRLEDITAAWSRDPRVAAVAGVWTGTGLSVDLTLVAERLLRENALPDNPNRVYSDEGIRKLDEWKDVWTLQDQEDVWEKATAEAKERGESPPKKKLVDPHDPTKELDAIPLPRKFDKQDFAKADYFATRGKLNVPRERFILFADLTPNRFGWNGWRDRERALAQVEAFTLAENDPQQPLPVPTTDDPRRCGATYGLWESLPDVRRWSGSTDHAELQTFAREACRQQRCPCPIVEAWKAKVLNAKATDPTNGKSKVAKRKRLPQATEERTAEPTVSIAARAWVASLFQLGTDTDAAGVWARHRSRLGGPAQGTIPGIPIAPVQLTMPEVVGGPPPELVSLDQTQLAAILDDLVASGDLQAKGRGSKKRFQLVPRGSSS